MHVTYTYSARQSRLSMPTATIAHDAIRQPYETPPVISTPYGLCMLEIQGQLNLPHVALDHTHDTVDVDGHQAVRFGRLQFDDEQPSKVVLYIGNSQRLMGLVVDLPVPLGVVRIPTGGEQLAEMVDIVRKKLLFKERPLPVM